LASSGLVDDFRRKIREKKLGSSVATQSCAITHGVRVTVDSHFLPERSHADARLWVFAYHIRIENLGERTVQLLSRHWVITDSEGHVEEIRGPGVVGEQPILSPGEGFEYTSGCPLRTSFGTMHGSYQMINVDDGTSFEATIAAFALCQPELIH
jgi:ApaG protein